LKHLKSKLSSKNRYASKKGWLDNIYPAILLNFMFPKEIRALILDMDGVIWKDDSPIGDLSGIFQRIANLNIKVAFATNNSSNSISKYIERLIKFGIVQSEFHNIISSSIVMANELSKSFPEKGNIFVIGEIGLKETISKQGFMVLDDKLSNDIQAVVVGIDRKIDYKKLKTATLLIRRGIPFYGTNPDKTFPTPEGLVPGAGSLLAAIKAATDVDPIVLGKPHPNMIRMAREFLGVEPRETLVVGDRVETDIASGQADGCRTALVLSGVSTLDDSKKWSPPPDYIANTLSDLLYHND
jgi:4-nitrophenyl phosphatase